MVEPESLVLEQLRTVRGDIGNVVGEVRTDRVEMTAIRQHVAGMMTIQEHDHADSAGIKTCLDRIDERFEHADVTGPH